MDSTTARDQSTAGATTRLVALSLRDTSCAVQICVVKNKTPIATHVIRRIISSHLCVAFQLVKYVFLFLNCSRASLIYLSRGFARPEGTTSCVCHPDRSATGILSCQRTFGAEWRDPERVSFAMPRQGVLPRLPIATGPTIQGTGTIHGKNSLWQRVQGQSFGIPPLRAVDLWRNQDSRGAAVGMTPLMSFRKRTRIVAGDAIDYGFLLNFPFKRGRRTGDLTAAADSALHSKHATARLQLRESGRAVENRASRIQP